MMWTSIIILGVALAYALPELLRKPMNTNARRAVKGKFANLPSGKTHYSWEGPKKGPVAVCVHGLTTGSYVWLAVQKILNMMGYRVLRYDLYGRGMSDRPEGHQDRAFFLRQLEELLADQGVEGDFSLFGYSMGGSIATAYAAQNPDRVDRLVLLATAGLGHTPSPFFRFCTRTPFVGDLFMRLFGAMFLRRALRAAPVGEIDGIAKRQAAETRYRGYLPAVLSSLRNMLADDLSAEHRIIAENNIPVLAIWGDADAAIPMTAVGRLAQINREARQVTLLGATHALPYSHSADIHAAMQDFLREFVRDY
ncbi:alpha/beta fold hydrolase [Actibacterium lipolyticum]|uniref:Lipase 1 n=1 Tax=Actibacterium lipolyticum TaxID=1524263 RepID=A0A238JJS5_9RHOB|nr:alpha/beta hydrolase [Actibacterium lipolyticum]SMX30663.1 Lipase 1 precursor [Actibacterium lipolyticum]